MISVAQYPKIIFGNNVVTNKEGRVLGNLVQINLTKNQ